MITIFNSKLLQNYQESRSGPSNNSLPGELHQAPHLRTATLGCRWNDAPAPGARAAGRGGRAAGAGGRASDRASRGRVAASR